MANVQLTSELAAEYRRLFGSCVISGRKMAAIDRLVDAICANESRYSAVTSEVGVPWHFIGVIHSLEADLDFHCHLHNGDPLTARTRQVPSGRPKRGKPPFKWEASAADALQMKQLGAGTDWSVPGTCYQLERYNGWGYRLYHPKVLSPYLWSGSCHYRCGKYVADGTWSASAVSKQIGAAVLIRRMLERAIIQLDGPSAPPPPPPEPDQPLVSRYSARRLSDRDAAQAVIALQTWLNTFASISLELDGIPGPKTSEAYRRVTGSLLPGDPRA